jgi:hypothetical protein
MRATVDGERRWREAGLPIRQQRNHSAVWWILSAHVGTLEKLSAMLRREGSFTHPGRINVIEIDTE